MADKVLSSGQVAAVFVTYSETTEQNGRLMYSVDFIIADTLEDCVGWFVDVRDGTNNKLDDTITGRCGMEGLMFALFSIATFIVDTMKEGEWIEACASDDRRASAYRRLCRYGFTKTGDYTYTYVK